MGLLAPVALGLATLTLPIVALYLLKIRRPVRTVPSLLLWDRVMRDMEANAPWQRFRPSWLLVLQLAALLALVLALARPVLEAEARLGTTSVVILDTSASMSAIDAGDGRSRFDAAQREIGDLIDRMPAGGDMLLLVSGAQATVAQPMTSNQDALRRALDTATPGTGQAVMTDALALAAATAERLPDSEIVIVTDGDLPEAAIADITTPIRIIQVGSATPENLGITALTTRRATRGDELFVQVHNASDGERIARVTIAGDTGSVVIAAQDLTLAPQSDQSFIVTIAPGIDVVRAEIAPLDAGLDQLDVDNVAWAQVRAGDPARVLLLTSGNLFLERALGLLPGLTVDITAPESGALPGYDLYVFDGASPPADLTAPALLIAPSADNPWVAVSGTTETPRITATLSNDPRLAGVSLADVTIASAQVLTTPEWATALATSGTNPMLLVGSRDGNPTAILAFDLHASDLPLRTAFPLLIANLIGDMLPGVAANALRSVSPGEVIGLTPRTGANHVEITGPDGTTTTVPASAEILYSETTTPGAYTVRDSADGVVLRETGFTVSLLSVGESDLRPAATWPGERQPENRSGGITIGTSAQTPLWTAVIASGLVVLAAEWWLFYRRGTRLRVSNLLRHWPTIARPTLGRRRP